MLGMRIPTAALVAFFLSIGPMVTMPAAAQHQNGLVNVSIGDIETGDILSNNNVVVGVAAVIAANVCGINVPVAVLSAQLLTQGKFRCDNKQTSKFVQITK